MATMADRMPCQVAQDKRRRKAERRHGWNAIISVFFGQYAAAKTRGGYIDIGN